MHVQTSVLAREEIDQFLNQYRDQCSTEITEFIDSNWVLRDGSLKHREIDFFEITAIRDAFDRRQLMIRQREPALVGLLCTTVNNERYVLVTARCEPGLHGICQLTSTIQSTPSNYLQRHKGSSTPFIEYFISRVDGSKTIHDSLQTDWGDYYLGKTKRFHIIEVEELLVVSGPQRWIRLSDLRSLVLQDYAVTSDLRVALLLLCSSETGLSFISTAPALESMPSISEALGDGISMLDEREIQMNQSGYKFADDYGRSIVFVDFTSTSREVNRWSQPLMEMDTNKRIDLWIDERTSDTRFAVRKGTQVGLQGIEQWFPAQVIKTDRISSNSKINEVKTSAEGGRFYRHEVNLNLYQWTGEEFDGQVEWWNRDEILSYAGNSMEMSIELRMISALVF